MPDTRFSESRREWPRYYTPAEIKLIGNSLGLSDIDPVALEKLQDAVEGYQWASTGDEGVFPDATNKGRRQHLSQILKLCGPGAPDEAIETALNKLDGPTSQRLGKVGTTDRRRLARAVRRVMGKLPSSGPDPKRARRQFIYDLARIYKRVTGQPPGRRIHDQEYGPFRDFVISALEPFNAAWGCETDIKEGVKQFKSGPHKKKARTSMT